MLIYQSKRIIVVLFVVSVNIGTTGQVKGSSNATIADVLLVRYRTAATTATIVRFVFIHCTWISVEGIVSMTAGHAWSRSASSNVQTENTSYSTAALAVARNGSTASQPTTTSILC